MENKQQRIEQLKAEIATVKAKYDKSVGREAYKLGAKLRELQKQLNNLL